MPLLRPTALGWKSIGFYVVLIAVFYLLPYLNLFFLLLTFGSLLGCWDLLIAARMRTLPKVTLSTQGPVAHGELFPLIVHLAGRRGRPRAVIVSFRVQAQKQRYVFQTGSDGERATLLLSGLPRGIHEPLAMKIAMIGPLGLFSRVATVATDARVVVHPAPLAGETSGRSHDHVEGSDGEGRGVPIGLRAFREGDELRHVHWRASARKGKWVVSEWDSAETERLVVALDRRVSSEELERRLSSITAIAFSCQRRGRSLTLMTQGLSRTYGEGAFSFVALLEELARFGPLEETGPPPPSAPLERSLAR